MRRGKDDLFNKGAKGATRRHKAKIELALSINGVPFGFLCRECDECGFLCRECDEYRHCNAVNKAYHAHKRSKLSKLTMDSAAFKVQGFMRFLSARRLLRRRCREQWQRYYSSQRRRHYYCFTRTGRVSWHKPRVLGSEELRPFLTRDEAAFKMQQLHRNWRARERARNLLRRYWDRIYSPAEKRFYYHYKGDSPLVLPQRARWSQPCRMMGREWIWRPLLTESMAALRVQTFWRAASGRREIRDIVRRVYSLQSDPITGRPAYRNNITGEVQATKPVLLGSELWDPVDMMQWGVDQTIIFIRRCGLKPYARAFRRYGVDGALLLTLDPSDLALLGMDNPIHVKRVLLGIERRPGFQGYNTRPEDMLRRTALRQACRQDAAAAVLQRWWRRCRAIAVRRNLQRLHELDKAKKIVGAAAVAAAAAAAAVLQRQWRRCRAIAVRRNLQRLHELDKARWWRRCRAIAVRRNLQCLHELVKAASHSQRARNCDASSGERMAAWCCNLFLSSMQAARIAAAKLERSKVWWTQRHAAYTGPTGIKDYGPRGACRLGRIFLMPFPTTSAQGPKQKPDYGLRGVRLGARGWGAYAPSGRWLPAPNGYDPVCHPLRAAYEDARVGATGKLRARPTAFHR
ncbi:hypothetical protein JKP88DRAFT_273977 [Tribonema minus]|uniref:Uncharacterized protein n=1 Tax=Tribonema minus TaxID=303371 RepID=A0A835YL39_9STRA|nr:hypothetical protein JKP88DRAFT_273977 [Tribonema minus]